jgi:16S rRNA processing protein RimM
VKTTGRITKTHGFEGAVVVRSEGGITREPKEGEPVFVIIDGIPVPFFTREAYSPSPGTLIIAFDDYMTAESVEGLKGCELRTAEEDQDENDLSDLAGYMIIDRTSGFSGAITRIIQNPGQLLAVVNAGTGEIYVPLHPDLIISMNRKKKTIEMSLPEGLAGINS